MTKEEQLYKLSNEFLSSFLGFAINKVSNIDEAEELAQEIAFQCVVSLNRNNITDDFDSYVWSIAHNTFKRWCGRKKWDSLDSDDCFSNIKSNDIPVYDRLVCDFDKHSIRHALSHLAYDYRRTMVCFYYDELSISEISKRLSLSEGMVKFFLRAGKQKLKEEFCLEKIGVKSFNPSEFSVYKSGIDFSKVNVWEVFKRKLPCQIAIVCHDGAKTISDISIETGVPAVYVEEEIELLLEAGVVISPVKNKFRTNFHILDEETSDLFKEQFKKLYDVYVPSVVSVYDKYSSELKGCDVFKFDATDNQLKWFLADNVIDFDSNALTADDYPQILSCGSKAVVFAEATKGSEWAAGQTPTFLDKCIVYPCDVVVFGEYHRQKELWDASKAQALYDVYCNNINEDDKEIYAELIKEGYVLKINGELFCNVAVSTVKSRMLFDRINSELSIELKELCGEIRKGIHKIVKATIPEQLSQYVKGYTETWIAFLAGVYFREALYQNNFISIPDDLTPVACWIYEK